MVFGGGIGVVPNALFDFSCRIDIYGGRFVGKFGF